MTTVIALAGFIVIFIPWLYIVGFVEWTERHRPERTGLTRMALGMTIAGGVMMYFGLAVIKSWGGGGGQ